MRLFDRLSVVDFGGCSSVWLECRSVTPEVAGSSPVSPVSPRKGAVAQSGRALESHSRGRGFESRRLHFCHRSSEVEHSIRNRAVVGSIPTGGLVEGRFAGHAGRAGIAQLVERNLAKVEVAGSNPVACLYDSSQHVVRKQGLLKVDRVALDSPA